jgi:hypothetical protein
MGVQQLTCFFEICQDSIDIDLTYVPIADRESSFAEIGSKLVDIENRVKTVRSDIITSLQRKDLKLFISHNGALIKIEVNQINRGCISDPEIHILCENAQETFDAFCELRTVPNSQLFGGKIIAALDRQHPRDMFDIKYLLEEGGINDDIKPGFILCLLSSNRPIFELLNPLHKNQEQVFVNQFSGMTDEAFSYKDYEKTREVLISEIYELVNDQDKEFILNFKRLTPDWTLYDLEDFPAIKWKLKNLENFKENNESGYKEAFDKLAGWFNK